MSSGPSSHSPSAARPGEPMDDARLVLEQSTPNVALGLSLQAVVFILVGMQLLLLFPNTMWSIKLIVIALVFLTLKHWGGILVLMAVQADLFIREGRRFETLNSSGGFIYVFIVVAVLMLVARNRLLLKQIAKGSVSGLVKNLLAATPATTVAQESAMPEAIVARMVGATLRGLAMLLGCVTAARFLLSLLPTQIRTEDLRQIVNGDPSLSIGVLLIVSIVAAWVVASEVSWRQLSTAQARVYLRSVFMKIHYRDLRMIVVRRIKLRQQRATEKKKSVATSAS